MPTFAYVVKDKAGTTRTGTLESKSRKALIEQLWKQELVVLSIDERQAGTSFLKQVGQPRVKPEQIVVFSRQLATMVDSGIPIAQSLDVLGEQMEDKHFGRTLKKIRDQIEAGESLSEAIGRHPRVFSEFFMNMIRAGESSGRLDEILDRVASYFEKATALQRKVRSSLFYPAFVSVLAFGITAFLIIVIVPKFKEIFTALGGQLPLPTRLLLGLSEFMGKYLVYEVLVFVGLGLLLRGYVHSPVGRLWFDGTILKLPVIGKLLQKAVIAQFSRTLATLVKSGVPILSSLEIVAKTSGNRVVERAVLSARSSIKEGENIADPLAHSKVFPPMVTRMISVGEKTGELEKMLLKIADFYENEVDAAVTALTSLIEPLVIGILGVVVGGIVIALFLPIFKISTLVAK
ncbi:MAG: type II secretion system F family protein [Candidatus Omnitrophica bacterium]|nr:type II secretion system F family protein [Candidatus Omnitrophota bacterium]MBI3021500.1 type II secretion system F family protein [Candidatus Omnitrophota bacterium]